MRSNRRTPSVPSSSAGMKTNCRSTRAASQSSRPYQHNSFFAYARQEVRQVQEGNQERERRSGRWTWLASLLILHPLRKANHRVPEEAQASSAQGDRIAAPSDSSQQTTFRLVHLQTAVLFPPAVEGLHRDLGFFTGLWGGFSVRDAHFDLPQHRYDLLWLVPLDRHDLLFLQVDFLSFHLVQKSPVTSNRG